MKTILLFTTLYFGLIFPARCWADCRASISGKCIIFSPEEADSASSTANLLEQMENDPNVAELIETVERTNLASRNDDLSNLSLSDLEYMLQQTDMNSSFAARGGNTREVEADQIRRKKILARMAELAVETDSLEDTHRANQMAMLSHLNPKLESSQLQQMSKRQLVNKIRKLEKRRKRKLTKRKKKQYNRRTVKIRSMPQYSKKSTNWIRGMGDKTQIPSKQESPSAEQVGSRANAAVETSVSIPHISKDRAATHN